MLQYSICGINDVVPSVRPGGFELSEFSLNKVSLRLSQVGRFVPRKSGAFPAPRQEDGNNPISADQTGPFVTA